MYKVIIILLTGLSVHNSSLAQNSARDSVRCSEILEKAFNRFDFITHQIPDDKMVYFEMITTIEYTETTSDRLQGPNVSENKFYFHQNGFAVKNEVVDLFNVDSTYVNINKQTRNIKLMRALLSDEIQMQLSQNAMQRTTLIHLLASGTLTEDNKRYTISREFNTAEDTASIYKSIILSIDKWKYGNIDFQMVFNNHKFYNKMNISYQNYKLEKLNSNFSMTIAEDILNKKLIQYSEFDIQDLRNTVN